MNPASLHTPLFSYTVVTECICLNLHESDPCVISHALAGHPIGVIAKVPVLYSYLVRRGIVS